jgi:hypothetical protein
VAGRASSRSFPQTPDLLRDTQERWGAAMQGYVAQGCVPTLGGGMTLQMPGCRAFALVTDDPKTLKGFEEEGTRVLTLSGAGPFWLVGRWHPGVTPPGWTCQAGTHYCWMQSATAPVWPSGTVRLAYASGTAGTLTSVQVLAPTTPLDPAPLDAIVYATQYGLRCDGVSDNSVALQTALAALPGQGGVVVLPAAAQECLFSQPLVIRDKTITIRGAGGARAQPKTPRTVLTYTGAGTAMQIVGTGTQGSQLVGFDLSHRGTADYGVAIDDTSSIFLNDLSIAVPPVPFVKAAIIIGNDANNPPHSVFLQNVFVRGASSVGVWIAAAGEYVQVSSSKILRNFDNNVQIGRLSGQAGGTQGTADDIHLLGNTFENQLAGTNAIAIYRGEGVWIKDNHFEIGPPTAEGNPARVLQINAVAERAAPIIFADNRVTALAGATEAILVNLDTALVSVERNWFSDLSGGTLTAWINNLAGRYLVVGMNRIDGPAPILRGLANVTLTGNWRQSPSERMDGFWPYRVCASANAVATPGSGEQVLATCTILGNTLFQEGMGLQIVAGGNTASNSNSKRVRLYLGSSDLDPAQVIWDSGALAADSDHWDVACTGLRASSVGIQITCRGQMYDTQPGATVQTALITVSSWTGSKDLTVTGLGSSAGDVSIRVLHVQALP